MSEVLDTAFKSLALYPWAQILLLIVVASVSTLAARRGERDRQSGGSGSSGSFEIPMYLMGGPVHDAMTSIHRMAEEGRKTNAILSDIDKAVIEFNIGQKHTHRLLENIMNNQEMRDPRSKKGL